MGMTTRLDRALSLTSSDMFEPENGGRGGVVKVVVLVTDGTQSPDDDAKDPSTLAQQLR